MSNPGMNPSLAGAVDLSGLVNKNRAPAPSDSAPSDSALIRAVNDQSLGQLVEISRSVPVILEIYGGELTPQLGPLIESYQGKFVLGTVRGEEAPELVKALQIQGVPTIVALVGAQPIPLMQGIAPEQEMRPILDQVLELAAKNGVTGSVAPGEPGEEGAPEEPPLPSLHQEAFDALSRDDIPAALAAYQAALAQNPGDVDAGAGIAHVELLQRTRELNPDQVRRQAAENPADLDAALGVADLDMSTGHVDDACHRLLALYPGASEEDQNTLRERLLTYFVIAGHASDEVKRARTALTSLMY